jgi:hypothetical protein
VTLAIALVDRGRLSKHGDPVGLLVTILEDLNAAGLVTYTLRHSGGDIPIGIRATPLGYKMAGYERVTPEVGSSRARTGAPLHMGPTDFRSQQYSTTGGPIERMSLADHLDKYPDHQSIHPHPWECGPYRGASIMARSKVDHSSRVVETLARLGGEATWADLNRELGGVNSTTHRILQQALDARAIIHEPGQPWRLPNRPDAGTEPDEMSSREVIIDVLERFGEQEDDRALQKWMASINSTWRSMGLHSLDHQLFSMQKAGLIEMDVHRNGSVQRLSRIRLPKRTVERVVEMPVQIPTPEVTEQIVAVVEGRFPILDSLRARARERVETSRRADAFLVAASALDGVAQDESDRLIELANEMASAIQLTPIEVEYLRFAETKDHGERLRAIEEAARAIRSHHDGEEGHHPNDKCWRNLWAALEAKP